MFALHVNCLRRCEIHAYAVAASLADNSRNLRLVDSHWLSGEIRKDGAWVNVGIDLAAKLGNRDGKFDFTGGTDFHRTATAVRVEGATLRAYLKKAAGYDYEDSINLALLLEVVDGKFAFVQCVYYLLLYAMGL